MYSIMIVDDEKAIRENLAGIVNFEEYGFRLCGTARNGQDALARIPKCRPDVIFLDVCMPVMDGLAFLQELHKREDTALPYVVMLSGYSDFEYARSAMRYGAKAYLTKPVDEEEVGVVLKELKDTLDEKQKTLKHSDMKEQVKRLKSLYHGGDRERTSFQGYQMMHCVILRESPEAEEGWRLIRELAEERLYGSEAAFCRNQGCILSYLAGPETLGEYQQSVTLFARHLLHQIKKRGMECALLFDSVLFERAQDTFRRDYDAHLYQMLTELFWGKEAVIQCRMMETSDFFDRRLDGEKEYIEKIRRAVRDRNAGALREVYEEIDEAVRAKKLNIIFLQEINYRIYYSLIDLLDEEKLTDVHITPLDLRDTSCFMRYEDWREQLWRQLSAVYSCMENTDSGDGIGEQALTYIQRHFREQISLKSVADKFYVSPSYLGRCLQKALKGSSFRQYLNDLRIREAKRLLRDTDKMIYEIAQEAGFTESKYFISKFTDLTGMTPAEFRRVESM